MSGMEFSDLEESESLENQGIGKNMICSLWWMHTIPEHVLSCIRASSTQGLGIAQKWCCLHCPCSTAPFSGLHKA